MCSPWMYARSHHRPASLLLAQVGRCPCYDPSRSWIDPRSGVSKALEVGLDSRSVEGESPGRSDAFAPSNALAPGNALAPSNAHHTPGNASAAGLAAQQDLELLQRTSRGDPAAVEHFLVRMHFVSRVTYVLNARFGSPLDAHDLADLSQDALMLVWRKLEAFDGRSPLESWVYGIVRLEFMNTLRKKRRRPELDDSAGDDSAAPDSEPAVDAELLRRGLERIDPEESRMIRLHHFEDLTFEDAASRLGIAVSTAKSRYYRGIEKLQELLRGRAQDAGG
jgi:RNA polymerase sigma factor (sigma-70 family)